MMPAEMDSERDALIRRELGSFGLGAILAWFPEDLVITGGTWSCLGTNLCLYPLDGQPVYYMAPNEPEDSCPPGFLLHRFAMEPGNWTDLRAKLRADLGRLGLTDRKVGVARDGGQHAVTSFPGESPLFGMEQTQIVTEDLNTVDANALFTRIGLVKTRREIDRIRIANTVAGAGIAAFYASVEAGRSEAEVAAIIEEAIQSRSGKDGCRLARAWAMVQGGRHIYQAGTFSRSSGNLLGQGDMVLLELGTCVDGYWSDLTRTACVGKANERQRALLTAVQGAQATAMAAARPGVTHEEVDRAARSYLESRGFGAGFTHNCGHHVGFRYHDRGPTLQKGSAAPLESGMVITIEPGCYGAEFGGGCRFEDNILITENGMEVLSPKELTWRE
jgi:Xaa-Pro aminopeptidase